MTAATCAAGVSLLMEFHISSATFMARLDSVLKSNDETAALTKSGNMSNHLDWINMAQQQVSSGFFSLQMSFINFLAVCDGVPSKYVMASAIFKSLSGFGPCSSNNNFLHSR